jgi:dolichol-phosphate mannosyltransferase
LNEAVVIIPTYNERENIVSLIEHVFNLREPFHIVVVDDSSPDGTSALVKLLQQKFNSDWEVKLHLIERKGKLGLGTAYITGFKYALNKDYKYILEMDADFSHNPDDLVKLYSACKNASADMAIGSRYATGVNVVNWPMGRVLLSYCASMYVRLITGMPVRDTTAGFVCYSGKVLRTINLDKIKFVGYAFQIEMKFEAWKYGFNIAEVPIIFTDRTKGESKMSSGIFKEAFFGVLQMTIRSWFKKYIPEGNPV